MRSSIACTRCRRSKVKCVNDGVGTACRSCENSGRDCQYPPPLATGSRPRESLSSEHGGGEGKPKAKKRSHHSLGHERDSLRPLVDALDPRVLTVPLWQQLYDIFQMHYSADLPFLHPSTFLKPLRQGSHTQPSASLAESAEATAITRPPMSPEFLLAFLALTARFHPKLVTHHSPATQNRTSNPLIASEYYATAAAGRLSGIWSNEGNAQDIERIQALLMLGLHEWGMCRGARAWLLVGVAIRSAQAMGLQYDLDLDDEPLSRAIALPASSCTKDVADAFILQEIRRRTFWSCFIMDRYLSSGKYRPQMLHAKELRIQLPASDRSFLFGDKVRTLMLGEERKAIAGRADVQNLRNASVTLVNGNSGEPSPSPLTRAVELQEGDDDQARLEIGPEEGLVSRYVRVLEIYGRIIKWSCAGGRRTEIHPPWDPRSEFYQLRTECVQFKSTLPRRNTLTRQNTQAHISLKTSTPYMLVHTVYLLCQIILHREYVPFIPIRCSEPAGPLDPPLFPPEDYDVPPGFWHDSARECFRSAREIMDLARDCQEWGSLVETPIVGFAIYSVAFVGVYGINFPWMDPDGYMCTPVSHDQDPATDKAEPGKSRGFEAARKALEMIGLLRSKLHMADGWFKTINHMHKYIRRMKNVYRKNVAAMESNSFDSIESLSSSAIGGGLEEYKLLERDLNEFGKLADQDIEMADAEQRVDTQPLDATYNDDVSHAGSTLKSENGEGKVDTPINVPRSDSGHWRAINAAPSAADGRDENTSDTSNGHFRSYDYYNQPFHQPQQQSPRLPSDAHQIGSFRPIYTQDLPNGPAATPSLTSPASHSGTTASQASPTFEHQHRSQPYNAWPSHVPMQPASAPYASDVPYPQQQPGPIPNAVAYPTPAPPSQQAPHQPWNATQKEAWLNSLDTRLGGDDFAVFADGGEMAEWAHMSANRGYGGGWLSAVWGGSGLPR